MIELIAKYRPSGRYYFQVDGSVYLIKPPLAISEKSFVDPLDVFLRRSLDSDLVYDSQFFWSEDDLRAYVINDCALDAQDVSPDSK